jgi:hypothetical protein
MIKSITTALGALVLGGAALLITASTARAAVDEGVVKANIPFAFQVAGKTLPAGTYEIQIDRQELSVSVRSDPKGPSAMENIITSIADPGPGLAAEARVVFDLVGDNHILSEVWCPGADGVLVFAAKGPHKHHTLHIKL